MSPLSCLVTTGPSSQAAVPASPAPSGWEGGGVYYVGVDLAWGTKRPSGVAVLDDEGRLRHVSAHVDDADLEAALAPYVSGDCLVAIDAPLVVTNPAGNRVAEQALNRDFARFDAGAHPTNTGKPEFADVPRGARLAKTLGLDLDPASGRRRRAIEVYPHAATVALFRLGRTLKYKDKPGRSFSDLRSELVRLMDLLTSLAAAEVGLEVASCDDWRALVDLVEAATRKSDLRRVEDQVDAVVCAHVGRYADHRPEDTATYGDREHGAIITPTLPPDLKPSPRVRRSAGDVADRRVRAAVQAYAEQQPGLRPVTEAYVALVTTLLDDAGINYLSVTGRTKSVASFAAKADRRVAGRPAYPDPLADITDQVGIRVVTYLRSDVTAVADLLRDELHVLDDRDMGEETASEGRFGYASRHLLVEAATTTRSSYDELGGRHAQVQVRTVLQHAWAEFEHAIRYKGTIPEEHASDLDRRFTLAAGLLELADQEFTTIRDRLRDTGQASTGEEVGEPAATGPSDPRIGPEELAAFLGKRFADADWSRPDHYAWISGLLLELGITSLRELEDLLTSVDSAVLNQRMGYRYPPGAVRRLDDALLAVKGERYVALHGNRHREELLRARLDRLGSEGPPEPGAEPG